VADDPYADPVTGVLLNKLGLGTAADLEAAEREITHAALILLGESLVHPGYDLPHVCASTANNATTTVPVSGGQRPGTYPT
jgi:fido (protein-threonine AMPylation protein)